MSLTERFLQHTFAYNMEKIIGDKASKLILSNGNKASKLNHADNTS